MDVTSWVATAWKIVRSGMMIHKVERCDNMLKYVSCLVKIGTARQCFEGPRKMYKVCVILISQFIQYRMRTSYERLCHTNSRYGGAASVALRRVARGPDSWNHAARLRKIGGGIP
eukprot:6214426-Pleurochrysis_carterae.AAC.1